MKWLFLLILFQTFIRFSTQSANSSSTILKFFQRSIRSTSSNEDYEIPFYIKIIVYLFSFCLLVFPFLIGWIWKLYKEAKENRYSGLYQNDAEEISSRVMNEEITYENFKEMFEINGDLLKTETTEHELGEGYFGLVIRGKLKREPDSSEILEVAVKVARDNGKKKELLLKEILVMCAISSEKHPNILAIIGAITTDPEALSIVIEIAHMDLRNYLRKHQKKFTDCLAPADLNNAVSDDQVQNINRYMEGEYVVNNDLDTLDTFDLVLFAYQIANGMKHLASIPCVHRDLALRNILITANKTIRIGDFGLARKNQDSAYYTVTTETALPRHVAPETEQFKKFTEKSDIWSSGLCLYDLFMLGKMDENDTINSAKQFSIKNKRFEQPQYCRSEIFEFMELCWNSKPSCRPNFITAVYVFKCELGRFSDSSHEKIEAKLKMELEEQKKLEDWVPKKKQSDN